MKLKLRLDQASASEVPSPKVLLWHLVSKLVDVIPIEEQNVRAALCQLMERTPSIYVVRRGKCVEIGAREIHNTKHAYKSSKRLLAAPIPTLLGNNGDVKSVLENLADRASSGRKEAYFYVQQIIYLDTIAALSRSRIRLGALPTHVPPVDMYPYEMDWNKDLEEWLFHGKWTKFRVQGEFRTIEESDVDHAKLLLDFVPPPSSPSPDEKQASSIREFFRSFPVEEWETVVQKLLKEGKLLRLEQVFYDTEKSDPARLRRVLNSIVETMAWNKYVALKAAVEQAYSDSNKGKELNEQLTKIQADKEMSPESKLAEEREVLLKYAREKGLRDVIDAYESRRKLILTYLYLMLPRYAKVLTWASQTPRDLEATELPTSGVFMTLATDVLSSRPLTDTWCAIL